MKKITKKFTAENISLGLSAYNAYKNRQQSKDLKNLEKEMHENFNAIHQKMDEDFQYQLKQKEKTQYLKNVIFEISKEYNEFKETNDNIYNILNCLSIEARLKKENLFELINFIEELDYKNLFNDITNKINLQKNEYYSRFTKTESEDWNELLKINEHDEEKEISQIYDEKYQKLEEMIEFCKKIYELYDYEILENARKFLKSNNHFFQKRIEKNKKPLMPYVFGLASISFLFLILWFNAYMIGKNISNFIEINFEYKYEDPLRLVVYFIFSLIPFFIYFIIMIKKRLKNHKWVEKFIQNEFSKTDRTELLEILNKLYKKDLLEFETKKNKIISLEKIIENEKSSAKDLVKRRGYLKEYLENRI